MKGSDILEIFYKEILVIVELRPMQLTTLRARPRIGMSGRLTTIAQPSGTVTAYQVGVQFTQYGSATILSRAFSSGQPRHNTLSPDSVCVIGVFFFLFTKSKYVNMSTKKKLSFSTSQLAKKERKTFDVDTKTMLIKLILCTFNLYI